jgi:hypothetical protein
MIAIRGVDFYTARPPQRGFFGGGRAALPTWAERQKRGTFPPKRAETRLVEPLTETGHHRPNCRDIMRYAAGHDQKRLGVGSLCH